MKHNVLNIKHLDFTYPGENTKTLEDLNLFIPEGSRFGLFGPNGAGKTTLLNLIMGVYKPDKGEILWSGKATEKRIFKSTLGYVPQHFSFYHELSPWENLYFFGAWAGMHKSEIKTKGGELLEALGLTPHADKAVGQFSGGMKRRVNLAIGMIHSPIVLLLDEPTAGVDIQSRAAIINYLIALNQSGTTLLYTSHHLQEAEDLCTEIALIDGGKTVAHDTLQNLLKSHDMEGLEGLFLHLTGHAYRD